LFVVSSAWTGQADAEIANARKTRLDKFRFM